MPTIQINKKEMTDYFLNPISRISEECSLTFNSEHISTLVNDSTGAIILYSKLKTNTGLSPNETLTLNFKDLRKLIKIFDCIPLENFELTVNDNASIISHKSPSLSFKLHLVLDSVIKKCTVSLDKISKLTFDSDFIILQDKISEILKGSIFSSSDKVYFYTKNNEVYAELTDKATSETDSITFNVSKVYNGSDMTTPLPFNIEILRLINALKCDKIIVKINNAFKILLFEISNSNVMFKYIIPGYTK